jgi:hypothetical protein
MNFSTTQNAENDEISIIKNKISLSLPPTQETISEFNTINEVVVPVNQLANFEKTIFKMKDRIYRNPNLQKIFMQNIGRDELLLDNFEKCSLHVSLKKSPPLLKKNNVLILYFYSTKNYLIDSLLFLTNRPRISS